MDPEAFTARLFKWDPRPIVPQPNCLLEAVAAPLHQPHFSDSGRLRELCGLDELFEGYGIRDYTAAKIAELGFTVNTLLDMKDEELDDMMNTLSQIFRWELHVREGYGIKAAVRAQRRRLKVEEFARRRQMVSGDAANAIDALSQEGLSEELVQQHKEAAAGGGGGKWGMAAGDRKIKQRQRKGQKKMVEMDDDDETDDDDENEGYKRQREHPFIVTEPGEVARGKKNGLDYLFHLYDECRQFLIQVQNIAKQRGEKCPVKVTNEVFRYATKAGATYINKPKMRFYVHCYALHCLDEDTSNELRRGLIERGERNVGPWRQACYKPLVAIAARQGWDIEAIFNAHPRLAIWYVPPKLRQLCHAERHVVTAPEHFNF
ncbi:hypothetical protein M5689_017562 [Euphorbia peplus]|nr:hypothetical protein M5689_017562 [Euphorbia peplus]